MLRRTRAGVPVDPPCSHDDDLRSIHPRPAEPLHLGGAGALFVALTLLAASNGRAALSDEQTQAPARAVGYTQTVLFDALDADLLADQIRGPDYRDLIIEVTGGIMTDVGFARVRIWSPDGTLLFSTESLEQIGTEVETPSEPEADTPAEPGAPSVDAMDLRARLVRSAARKKFGSHLDDEPGA
jgi:hypothetical protein